MVFPDGCSNVRIWCSLEACIVLVVCAVVFWLYQVTESEQVLSVKKLIAKEFDVPEERQRLVFKGKTLAGM